MGNEILSLDERLQKARRLSKAGVKELFEELSMMKATSINYWGRNEEITMDTIECVMEEAKLDADRANELSVKEFMLLLNNSICMADEEYWQDENKEDKLELCDVYLNIFINSLKYSKSKNRILELLWDVKVRDFYECAFMAQIKGNMDIKNKVWPLYNYFETHSYDEMPELSFEENRAYGLLLNYNLRDNRTIGELVNDLLKRMDNKWLPGNSLKEYENDMRNTYFAVRDSLYRPFLYICAEGMTIPDVLAKYAWEA